MTTESGIRTGINPSTVSIRAATDGWVAWCGVGINTGREISWSRSRSQTKTDVGIFKTKACRTCAGNAAHHVQLIGYVAAKSDRHAQGDKTIGVAWAQFAQVNNNRQGAVSGAIRDDAAAGIACKC